MSVKRSKDYLHGYTSEEQDRLIRQARQLEIGGDPFVGAKLGNLLQAVGCRDTQKVVKAFLLDSGVPGVLDRAASLIFPRPKRPASAVAGK